MYLKHLSLRNFRNYRELELEFPRALTLLQGPNAQGKTNLLEAIYFLATSRSPQARADRQVIHWDTEGEPLPFSRLVAELEKGGKSLTLEVAIAPANLSNGAPSFRKQIRVNGMPRRAIDLVGEMKIVLFLPQDIDLIAGSPASRRHYLDVALCQIDREYCRRLTEYNQILPRRNRLLRQIQERCSDPHQLDFWDEKLAAQVGAILARRREAVTLLGQHVQHIHGNLTGQREDLELTYSPSFLPEDVEISADQISAAYLQRLSATHRREIAAGATLIGPHRDDLHFTIGGHDLQQYGSRGQQRTACMAMKLAEVELMIAETAERPILLLDDVMSELDGSRRQYLSHRLEQVQQAVITTTDLEDYEPAFLERVSLWHVFQGRLVEHTAHKSRADIRSEDACTINT